MEVTVEKTIIVNLAMNTNEAAWLQAVMQNQFSSEESKEEKTMRQNLFNTLRDQVT